MKRLRRITLLEEEDCAVEQHFCPDCAVPFYWGGNPLIAEKEALAAWENRES